MPSAFENGRTYVKQGKEILIEDIRLLGIPTVLDRVIQQAIVQKQNMITLILEKMEL